MLDAIYLSRVVVYSYMLHDILLLSPSIAGLQLLVNACELECDSLDMQINVQKSCCVRFGNKFNEPCSEIISKHGGAIH